jgi:hypothetical protein
MNLNKDVSHNGQSKPKNTAQGSFLETAIESGFIVMTYQNETSEVQLLEKEIDSSFIQFHFCSKGECKFVFNNGTYSLNIPEENSLLLYNPQRNLPIYLEVDPASWVVSVLISIKKFHGLFSHEADYDSLLKALADVQKVQQGMDAKLSGDLLAIDIRQALYHFGEITGEITSDDLLGNIFANFCIGK